VTRQAGDIVLGHRLIIYGLLVTVSIAVILFAGFGPGLGAATPGALAGSPGTGGSASPAAREAPYQIAVVDLNKLLMRHRDYSQLLAIQGKINELGKGLQPATLGPIDLRAGQQDLMLQQQSAGAEMRAYVNSTREMLQLKQRGATEELMARERALRAELAKLYQETREAIQKEARADVRKRETPAPASSPSPAPPPSPSPAPAETPSAAPVETPSPEPEEEEPEPPPTSTAAPPAQTQEAYNPAEDPEFLRERKTLQKQFQAYVNDLFALRDRQAAARKLELEKELSEKLSARKRELDRQLAEYDAQVMKANQNTKLNLQLKLMNASSEEEGAALREELSRIAREESEKKDVKRKELNGQYEQYSSSEKSGMEKQYAAYRDELTRQIKEKVAGEEKKMDDRLNQKLATLAAARKVAVPSPTPTVRPTRRPKPRRTAAAPVRTPVPLPTLAPPPSPEASRAPATTQLEGAKFRAPEIRRRYEEKRKALIAEFEAFKKGLEERIKRENQLSSLQVKGKERELNERMKAYQASIIQELQDRNQQVSQKERERQKKVQKAMDALVEQKMRLLNSMTAELKEKVAALAQREGFSLVVSSYLVNAHCTDLTDFMLQEFDSQVLPSVPSAAPSVNVPVGVPQATSPLQPSPPGAMQGTPPVQPAFPGASPMQPSSPGASPLQPAPSGASPGTP